MRLRHSKNLENFKGFRKFHKRRRFEKLWSLNYKDKKFNVLKYIKAWRMSKLAMI